MAGYPMRPHKEWLKLSAYEHRLPEMVKTVKQLQKEIDALKAQLRRANTSMYRFMSYSVHLLYVAA